MRSGVRDHRVAFAALQAGMAWRTTVTLAPRANWSLHQRLRRGPRARSIDHCRIRLKLHVVLVNVLSAFNDSCIWKIFVFEVMVLDGNTYTVYSMIWIFTSLKIQATSTNAGLLGRRTPPIDECSDNRHMPEDAFLPQLLRILPL